MQKITPFLWFNQNAEEAASFYTSVFKNSKLGNMSRYGEAGPGPAGSVMVATFQIEGQEFIALNGGPKFTFNESVSFVVNCNTQDELDYYWQRLTENGGQESMCGWLKDRFGLSWQIVPAVLPKLFQGTKEQSERVMQAMMQMQKMDIAVLEKAYEG